MKTDIRQEIEKKLAETESLHKVRMVFAIESGSRSWGFASPDSDYDCRFVYVHQRDWYLSVFNSEDVIEYAADSVFDINGWDLKKALYHLWKSNAVMFEWLSSGEVYGKDDYLTSIMQEVAEVYFNPVAVSYHYLNLAKKQLGALLEEEESKLKRYFYILRPIANLNFIREHGRMPYMEYMKTLEETDVQADVLARVLELLAVKKVTNEGYLIKRDDRLIRYFQEEIELFSERLVHSTFEKKRDKERIDRAFREIVEYAWKNEC